MTVEQELRLALANAIGERNAFWQQAQRTEMDTKLILMNQLAIMKALYVRGDRPDSVLQGQIERTRQRIDCWEVDPGGRHYYAVET